MRIYLDVSCLNRPFDDQRQTRIRLESEAVTLILDRIDAGAWGLLSSEIVRMEVAAMTDRERRRRVQSLFSDPDDTITLTEEVSRRAAELMKKGFKAADALHVASAEHLSADVLLTCDDRLIRLGRRNRKELGVAILDPVSWLREVSDASNLG
ncbi:MAG TPA: PIN domain-containing protein [Rhodothermales bacterium]